MIGTFILFALVFTAGATLFQVVNHYKQVYNVADANELSLAQQESLENLSLTAKLSALPDPWLQTGDLYVSVGNSGGVPSTIVGVMVSVPNGTVVSESLVNPPSHFLSIEGTTSQKGDLNVTLPLTLGVGVSTSEMSGCSPSGKIGCDIGISRSSFNYVKGTVVVSLLTSLGNVFSLEYPTPHSVTTKNLFVISPTDLYISGNYTSFIDQSVYGQSGVDNCYGCVTNQVAGGNILVMLITALPSPVQNEGTITVIATVSNYSPYQANSMTVNLNTYYTGSATVAPDGSKSAVNCPGPASIASGVSASYECYFAANSGGGSGTVTFAGTAEGCVVTGTTTTCPSGTLVTSAVSSSNPVQVGSSSAFGLWQLNYYYFTYTASGQKTPASPSIVPDSAQYAAFNLKVTNVNNVAMTILDNSYLQFVSPGSDVNEFIVASGSASGVSTSATAIVLTDSTLGATPGSLVGLYLKYTSGPASGEYEPITANTATTITTSAFSPVPTPGGGDTFTVVSEDYPTSGTPVFTPYGCTDAPPAPPTGPQCITVAPGATVTISFAASGPDASTWTWPASSPIGNGPYGCVINIIIGFTLLSNPANGITTSPTTATVLTDSTLGAMPGSLVGMNLKYTSGPASGEYEPITANTATTITTPAFLSAPTSGGGDGFAIFGTMTSATATVLTDSSLAAAPGSLVGMYLEYTSGPTLNQYQLITSNTATTITTAAFSPAPTPGGGDTFTIGTYALRSLEIPFQSVYIT